MSTAIRLSTQLLILATIAYITTQVVIAMTGGR